MRHSAVYNSIGSNSKIARFRRPSKIALQPLNIHRYTSCAAQEGGSSSPLSSCRRCPGSCLGLFLGSEGMVRGKVTLQRIDDGARRMVSFSKRRSGLLKKARELAVLCDAEVGVVVFSPKGKLSHFSSQSSLEQTFERCKRFLDEEKKVKNNVLAQKVKGVEFADHEMNHGLKVDQRVLDYGFVEQDINELTKLEDQLESELRKLRLRKTALLKDSGANLNDPERTLVCERKQLRSVMVTDQGKDEEDGPRNSQRAPEGGGGGGGSNAASPPGPLQTLQLFMDPKLLT